MTTRNSHFDSVRIKSTGSYVPSRILTNEEVLANLPTSPQWVVDTLGIRERHIAEPDEYTSDLAAKAGLDAIASAGLEPNDIELIIVSTATPDRKMPSSACLAQTKMGISNRCAAFDVAAVCAGFVYGITIAGQFIQNGMYERVLVIGADTFSKVTDWNHRDCVVFGDAAGAVVLEKKDPENGLFSSILLAEGEGADYFTVYPGDAYYKMNGKEVFKAATAAVPECILEILRINGMRLEDVLDDRSASGDSRRSQAHCRGTQHPFFPNPDELGVIRQHRRSDRSSASGPGKPTRSPARRRPPVAGVHRRRLDLGRELISVVVSDLAHLHGRAFSINMARMNAVAGCGKSRPDVWFFTIAYTGPDLAANPERESQSLV